jgi:hypothetical protein
MDWKEYQEHTAELFRRLGCSAEVDKTVQGVRAEHKIDVWVVFKKFGLEMKWVVECKYWNTNVPKEKVLALNTIIDDVGADRGIIISKTGFQSGAIKASQNSNITLTSLEKLWETANDDLVQSALDKLENKATELKYALDKLFSSESTGPNSGASKPLPGVNGHSVGEAIGHLIILGFGFDHIRLKQPPYPVKFDETGNSMIVARTVDTFVELATSLIDETETILSEQQRNIKIKSEADA